MATGAPTVDPELLAAFVAAADPDGFLPFDRFMDLALYAEKVGYYARATSPFGVEGDFYTAAQVHPLFAATLAGRIAELRRGFPRRHPFLLVELGPGDGRLAEGIVSALGKGAKQIDPLSVVLIDRSPELQRRAVDRVCAVAEPLGIPVHARDSVGTLGAFEGVVLANELLDAQPVRRLRRSGGEWNELGVRVRAGTLEPAESALTRPVTGAPLPREIRDGTVYEFSPLAEGIVREVADHLVSGTMMIDDFGMEESEILAAHPDGTLDGIRAHRSGWDPVEAPGATDLSTFVNFTRIRAAATAAGLAVASDRRQAEALGEWGFPQLLEAAIRTAGSSEAEVRLRLAAKNLVFGFERFRILELEPARARGPSSG
ncbi:MAG: SAM-dependent methyltransferase [Thermoplasmata archaeon]